MPRLARADLERLLQARKLSGGPATLVEPGGGASRVAPSGLAALDRQLDGGWPGGQVSDIAGRVSTGVTWIVCASLAAATRRGELAALIDPSRRFDPESAAAVGFDWSRLLWVPTRVPCRKQDSSSRRGRAPSRAAPSSMTETRMAVERALKALALILQTEGFGLVVLDLQDVPAAVVRQLPFTTWRRMHRLVEGRDTACVIVHGEPLGRSAGGVTLALDPPKQGSGARWAGHSARARRLKGLAAQARVIRARWQPHALEPFAWATF